MNMFTEAAANLAAVTTGAKEKKPPKPPPEHPKYIEMIKEAIEKLGEKGGSSRQAILKYIMENFKVGDDEKAVNTRVKSTLNTNVKNGKIRQCRGTGASGSFKIIKSAWKSPSKKNTKKRRSPKKGAKGKKGRSPSKKGKAKKPAKKKSASKKPKASTSKASRK